MRFLKLLQLLSRFQKPRDRRRRAIGAALPSIAACERVLEQRVLLSAVGSDVVQESLPASDDAPSSSLAPEATGQASVASGDPDGVMPGYTVGPLADVSSGPFHFDRLALAVEGVVAGHDAVTVDAAVQEPPVDTGGFPAALGTKSPPQFSEVPETELQADSTDDIPEFEQEPAGSAPADPEPSVDDSMAALEFGAQAAQGPSFEQLNPDRRLRLSQNTEPGSASHPLIPFDPDGVEFRRSNFGVTGVVQQARSLSLAAMLVARPSVSGAVAGGSVDLLRASQAVWSELSGLMFFGPNQSGLAAAELAGGTLPAWLTQGDRIIGASELIQFARTSVIPRGFAEVAEPAGQDSFHQTTKHALARIEAEIAAVSVDAVLSDDPPERSDIPGVWQSLRFDCNPRGPPGDDSLISEFTRQTGGGEQLQQLRFSIAPRGPSVAFCS